MGSKLKESTTKERGCLLMGASVQKIHLNGTAGTGTVPINRSEMFRQAMRVG